MRSMGLALFAASLVVIAMAQDVSVSRPAAAHVAQTPSAQIDVVNDADASPLEAESELDAAEAEPGLVVPDIEGMTYTEAIELVDSMGFDVSVFDATQHAASAGDFEPASDDAYVTAVMPRPGETSEDRSIAVAVSWNRRGLPDAARRDPWWWPGHVDALAQGTTLVCFDCHEQTGCTQCHVGRAHTYVQPGEDSPDANAASTLPSAGQLDAAQEAVTSTLARSGTDASLRDLAGGAGVTVLVDIDAPDDPALVARIAAAVVPGVFESESAPHSVTLRFYEPDSRLPYLTVSISSSTSAKLDWDRISVRSLAQEADGYMRAEE